MKKKEPTMKNWVKNNVKKAAVAKGKKATNKAYAGVKVA